MHTVTKAVIPAAGAGTRFLPATKALPKEMLPIVDKPLIQYAIEEACASGIHDLTIVTGRGKTAIEDHFDTSLELEYYLNRRGKSEMARQVHRISRMVSIAFVRQHEVCGLGDAILQARCTVAEHPFAVMLADDLILADPPCIAQMIQLYEQVGETIIALQEIPPRMASTHGIAWGRPALELSESGSVFRLSGVVEKPDPGTAPSNLGIIGRYILRPEIMNILAMTSPKYSGEVELTDALGEMIQCRPVYGVLFRGRRFDAGTKLGFLQATIELALAREDLGVRFREYLRGIVERLSTLES